MKPTNILLYKNQKNEYIPKIVDLGFSKILEEKEIPSTYCGTHHYIAPEILLKFQEIDTDVDIYR